MKCIMKSYLNVIFYDKKSVLNIANSNRYIDYKNYK